MTKGDLNYGAGITASYLNYAREDELVKNTTANFSDDVHFTLTIKNLKGAENLVLKDTMDNGFNLKKTFNKFYPQIMLMSASDATNGVTDHSGVIDFNENVHYTCTIPDDGNKESFTIKFTPKGYEEIAKHPDYVLRISYTATVNNQAKLNNTNTAELKYADNQKTEDKAYVGTLNIPVYKYTSKLGVNKALPGAEFTLYKNEDCTQALRFSKVAETSTYNYSGKETDTATLTSDSNGNIAINGLAEGTYYLKETKAPDGYNLLRDKIEVTIKPVVNGATQAIDDQTLNVLENGELHEYDKVSVLNNAGSLLPSTGGMGTTLIYLIGGALVLGSGFVLANKKRAKAK